MAAEEPDRVWTKIEEGAYWKMRALILEVAAMTSRAHEAIQQATATKNDAMAVAGLTPSKTYHLRDEDCSVTEVS